MTAPVTLLTAGIAGLILCHGWWRNPSDYLVQLWTGFVSLFPERRR